MKVIIAGSRTFPSLDITDQPHWYDSEKYSKVYKILVDLIKESKLNITQVVSGRCWGMDQLGERWAVNNDKEILRYPADWTKNKSSAGNIRNKKMAEVGDALICVCTPDSKGSNNMIQCMNKLGKPVFVKFME